MNKWIVGLVATLLFGCSSNPVEQVNYYVLNGANSATNKLGDHTDKTQRILVEDIRLADYLKQSNLAMQLNTNQIFYSRQHAWAERLQVGLEKALMTDLNAASEDFMFIRESLPSKFKISRKLIIQIDHFVATDKSTVLATGSFWYSDGPEEQHYSQSKFKFEAQLGQDGYAHAIEQLRALVTKISQRISNELSA